MYLCGARDLEYLHGARDDVLDRLLPDATEEHGGDLPQRALGGERGLPGTPAAGGQVGLLLLLLRHPRHALRGHRGGHHGRRRQADLTGDVWRVPVVTIWIQLPPTCKTTKTKYNMNMCRLSLLHYRSKGLGSFRQFP